MTEQLEKILNDLPSSIRYSGELESLKKYAREQAKRVEELENTEYALQETYRQERQYNERLEKENQRFKRALEEIIDMTNVYSRHTMAGDACEKARNALKGESQ